MSQISFNEIPSAYRLPGALVEFDNTQAMQGASLMAYTVLLAGQMLPEGTAPENTRQYVSSPEQGARLYGEGSMLHQMVAGFFRNNPVTRLVCIAVKDNAAGVAATGTVTITGTVVAAAPIYLYIGGIAVTVPAPVNATTASIAASMATAINEAADVPVTATAIGSAVTLTAKHAGECGNEIDLRLSYYGEIMPAGITVAIDEMAGGAGNPDASSVIVAMADDWYHVIAWPWLDRSNLRIFQDELLERWGPLRHIDGLAIAAKNGGYGELVTFGMDGVQGNYQNICIMENSGSPTLPWVKAAQVVGNVANYGNIDPARPFQTLPLRGALAALSNDRLTDYERNLLLFSGIATSNVDEGGQARIERLITNYRVNANGAVDTSYLDANTQLTLSYLRYDFRQRILRKYPRHKLGGDDMQKVAEAGQAIMTPKTGREEAMAAAMSWQRLGLVENLEAFKRGLICVRNEIDPNRLDWRLTPDLVNQFRLGAIQIQFRLQEAEWENN